MATETDSSAETPGAAAGGPDERRGARRYVRLHLRFGWCSLLFFLVLGAVLETMHGLKIGWYLDVSNETRRLMWTLAHAHGTLLSLVHVAFAATVYLRGFASGRPVEAGEDWLRRASSLLTAATFLLPGGFFLGGIFVYSGDPGLGVLLVPAGAICLLVAALLTLRGLDAGSAGNTGSS